MGEILEVGWSKSWPLGDLGHKVIAYVIVGVSESHAAALTYSPTLNSGASYGSYCALHRLSTAKFFFT